MAEKNDEPQSERSESDAPEQAAENRQSSSYTDADDTLPVQKIDSQDSGAKRDSYFKRRDYE